MAPVEQRETPVAVLHVALGLLRLVAVDVAHHPPHVVHVVVGDAVLRPVRESYDNDSSTSRLSRESATRNSSLGLLSDGEALKPLFS